MKKWITLILALLSYAPLQAQMMKVKSIPITASYFTTDRLANLYAVVNNGIVKYGPDGDSLGYYHVVGKGEITSIDASNPMRLLVLYNNIPQINVLNRLLIEQNTLDLKKIGIYNCPMMCTSADGDTWIYDYFSQSIKKVSDQLQTQKIEINLQQILGKSCIPLQILEQDRQLMILTQDDGILHFDRFGSYVTTYHLPAKRFQYINGQIVLQDEKGVEIYNTKAFSSKRLEIEDWPSVLHIRIEKDRLYIQRKDRIDILSITRY